MTRANQGLDSRSPNKAAELTPKKRSVIAQKVAVYNRLGDAINNYREASYAEYRKNKEKYDPRIPAALEGRPVEAAAGNDGNIQGQSRTQTDHGGGNGVSQGRASPGLGVKKTIQT